VERAQRTGNRRIRGRNYLAEGGLGGTIRQPAALVPEQLAYLAVGIAVAGEPSLATRSSPSYRLRQLSDPTRCPSHCCRLLSPKIWRTRKVRAGLRSISWRPFGLSQSGLELQPRYRRLLPWNVGLSPDAVLFIATFIARGVLEPQNLAVTGPYANVLLPNGNISPYFAVSARRTEGRRSGGHPDPPGPGEKRYRATMPCREDARISPHPPANIRSCR
jgi:hypothetical protein